MAPPSQPRVLFDEQAIRRRVAQLGAEIARDHAAGQDLCLVGVLKGAFVFLADLVRAIARPTTVEFVSVATYGPDRLPGPTRLLADLDADIAGRHVLLVDDIVDRGSTLEFLTGLLGSRHPASLRSCVLARKHGARSVGVGPDYVGFEVPDLWIVGYGLDLDGRHRALPYLGVVDLPTASRD